MSQLIFQQIGKTKYWREHNNSGDSDDDGGVCDNDGAGNDVNGAVKKDYGAVNHVGRAVIGDTDCALNWQRRAEVARDSLIASTAFFFLFRVQYSIYIYRNRIYRTIYRTTLVDVRSACASLKCSTGPPKRVISLYYENWMPSLIWRNELLYLSLRYCILVMHCSNVQLVYFFLDWSSTLSSGENVGERWSGTGSAGVNRWGDQI